ncbi:c-type cytochrome [Pseudorhodobacter wandonensis]|jgi:cytochrome c556|uniref:c-type cytochrome n=1 Tax=Pseudorhodobacter wandonensis TaxID=1120568 RepID=UPI00067DC4C5|nr:cytochrome c [Pseudorhodobacter wandonensis]
MKKIALLALVAALPAFATFAQETRSPFADTVEIRHGLMLQMAADLGKLGAIAKGQTPYDAATATKSAANLAAIASVISMDQFPAGSEVDAAPDSFALPAIWTNPDDFAAKITGLNDAASFMVAAAGKDASSIKGVMANLGGACGSCHKAYRQPEE